MEDMYMDISLFWTLTLLLVNVFLAVPAAIHALMNKQPVQSAIGWTAIILLSPFLGSIMYFCLGINRVSRRWSRLKQLSYREAGSFFRQCQLVPLKRNYDTRLGDRLSPFPMTEGNRIEVLRGGAQAYPAMLEAVRQAKQTVMLQSYIFDSGTMGDRFIRELGRAVRRGVEVRVLIDRVGAFYSRRSVRRLLRREGVKTAFFDDHDRGLHLPYANLRNHRKILVVDNEVAFTGGMNIRDAFALTEDEPGFASDTHFCLSGPVTDHLLAVFAQDWFFTTREQLSEQLWQKDCQLIERDEPAAVRVIPSEPDYEGHANLLAIIDAIAGARKNIMIQSAYFIPVPEMLYVLKLAAMRGVQVDILLPQKSNLLLVDLAAMAQLEPLAASGCRIWHMPKPFDHSKLMLIDSRYAYVGSSNMDTRSLRLNFEVDLEVLNDRLVKGLEAGMQATIDKSTAITLQSLQQRPFFMRLFSRLAWLLSPYL